MSKTNQERFIYLNVNLISKIEALSIIKELYFKKMFAISKTKISSKFKSFTSIIFTLWVSANTLHAQSNCCNNDTIYFENYIDCPICLEISCIDTINNTTYLLSIQIINDSTGYNNSQLLFTSCPNSCNTIFPKNYIVCGGPQSPQTGKIILPTNSCITCDYLKFTIKKIGNTILTPELTLFSPGNNTTTYINSPCCSHITTPNAELSFDCTLKKLTIKCVN
jgi:hypothetical protein